MKGLKTVNRTAAVGEDVLDPLSAFAQQSPTSTEKDDEFHVVDRTASINMVTEATENLASPNPSHFGKDNKSKNDSSPRPNSTSLQKTFTSGFNSFISSVVPRTTSLSPMRGAEGPKEPKEAPVTSPKKEPSPLRNQRGSILQPEDYDESIPLLSGENRIMSLIDASTHVISVGMITGTLYVTNYRIVFIPSKKEAAITNPSILSWLNIPLGSIDKLEKEKRSKDVLSSGNTPATSSLLGIQIVIYCKDCRQIRINIRATTAGYGEHELDRAFNLIAAYAFPNDTRLLFAYNHTYAKRRLIDLKEEYSRLGVLNKFSQIWKVSDINQQFKLCSSYPELLIIPSEFREDDLYSVASFRSGQRIPSLTWCSRSTGATLWRSSQPKAGVSGSSSHDERFVDLIARSNTYNKHVYDSPGGSGGGSDHGNQNKPAEPFLFIVDCRSRTSAMANRAAGAGYESQNNYPNTRLEFYNIPNIHAVRESYKNLTGIILNPTATPTADINFTKQIEDTQWLTNIRLILKASWDTATTILRGCPVLVHCSHGWDRTAQVCALAQLMLDPYYRTISGFLVLLEKEWLSFGHPFKIRCGHGHDKTTRQEEEMSPIFLQFLDATWQFIKSYSSHFEFNAQFLLTIADHIYSCRFGNFLFSCESQRKSNDMRKDSADLWAYLESNRDHFLNPHYIERSVPSTTFFVPPLGQLLRGVSLWSDFFLRWSSVSSLPKLADDLQQYLTATAQGEHVDDQLLPMSTSMDYWIALIGKERQLKQLYAAELVKVKQSSEMLLKKICEITADSEVLRSVKEEIEQQMLKLAEETTELLLLDQIKQSESVQATLAEEQNESNQLTVGTYDTEGNREDGETESGERREGNRDQQRGTSTDDINLTSEDLKEAESEVAEDVYAIYV